MLNRVIAVLNQISQKFKPVIKANIAISESRKLLKNKKILITGGSRGIGFEIAKKCVAEGSQCIITGRNIDNLKKASALLDNCKYIQFDNSNILGICDLLGQCEHLFNAPIDCIVNNAGISLHEGNILNVTTDTWDRQFDINLKAPYFMCQEFIRRIEKSTDDKRYRSTKKILFITSERGLYCDDIPYGLIKAAINSLTAGLGRRLLEKKVFVNAIAPGVTASEMTGYSKDQDLYRQCACGKRVYLPEEVAELAVFLLSDLSNCISSQIIPCNNGNHLRCDW